ncbi:unnamed protein product [Ixodes persulcatus]
MATVVSVVLPAAGTGERMNIATPKQFCEVQGKPLVFHTIEAFLAYNWISDIVVVCAPDQLSAMDCKLRANNLYPKVKLVVGGTTRHRSIYNGMVHMKQHPPDIVVIHDAVRPLVPAKVLEQVVHEAKLHGGAGPVVPLVSTVVKMTSKGFLQESLDRSKYAASETPQAFRYPLLLEAYECCTEEDFDCGTECLALLLKYCGVQAKLVPGSDELFKVTYSRDLYAASGMLKSS